MIIAVFFISACSYSPNNKVNETDESNDAVTSVNDGSMGDVREETDSIDKAPTFLSKHHDNMKILYMGAAQHKELLEHIPCYCGCGDSVGHEHNYHCFINENKEDGVVVWDDHATRCQVCLDIAADAIIEYNDGKSIDEIRDEIDKQYQDEGFPEPTPTKRFAS